MLIKITDNVKPNNDFNGATNEAYVTGQSSFAYKGVDGDKNIYGDSFEDVDGAVNAYGRAIAEYSHVKAQPNGTYIDTRTGKLADNSDVAGLESAKNDYRLSLMNRNNILEQTAQMIGGNHVQVKYAQDPITGEKVGVGYVDVESEKNRKLAFKGVTTLAERILDAHVKHKAHPQDSEEFTFGFGSKFNNLTSEQRVKWAEAVKKDPENAYKMFPGVYTELEPQNYYRRNPSEYGREFLNQAETALQNRYSFGSNGTKDNSINLLSVDQMLVDTKSNETYKSLQASMDTGAYDNSFYDPSGEDGGQMTRYTKHSSWKEVRRELQGVTYEDIDGTGRHLVGVVRLTPKDSKGYNESMSKTVVMDLKGMEDNVMSSEFGNLASAVKNYASQLSDVQQYGYGDKGVIATHNGNLHTRTSKDRKQLFIEDRDPFTGKTTGKEKSFTSRFEAAHYLAKQDEYITEGVPAVNKYVEVIGQKESGGNFKATSTDSSATGTYQILWDAHKDTIKAFAKENGINNMTQENFKNNPAFQEKFMKEKFVPDIYKTISGTNYVQAATAFNTRSRARITDFLDLMYLAHRIGAGGAMSYLTSKTPDHYKDPHGYNITNELLDFQRRKSQ
jgi:hypothetical protein